MRLEGKKQKLSKIIHTALSQLFYQKNCLPVDNIFVNITEVKVGSDLNIATIYLSIWGEEAKKKITFEYIQTQKQYITRMLARELADKLRKLPKLVFCLANSEVQEADRIEKLLNAIHQQIS